MNIMNPQTAVTKRKTGDLTIDLSQIVRNFTGAETDDNKKSVLQKLLEPKEVDKNQRDAQKILQIAKRIARGESVTPEEKELLRRMNPQLAQMAELARKEGERIKHALQQASSKEEQQTIIGQAYQQVAEMMKKNPQFGELLGEAVKAAIKDVQEDPAIRNKPETSDAAEKESNENHQGIRDAERKNSKSQPGIQKIKAESEILDQSATLNIEETVDFKAVENSQEETLEQFCPIEWMSMLDCKS